MNTNSENPKVGKDFELIVKSWFENKYDQPFELYKKIEIGNPPKEHCFDLSDKIGSIVVECKCYTWTVSGNVPSAKMAVLNEAILYLLHLPPETKKCIVMPKAAHNKHKDTLAEYYYKRYRHLLSDIHVLEYDSETFTMKEIKQVE